MWTTQGIMFRLFYHLHKLYKLGKKEGANNTVNDNMVVHMDFNHTCIVFSYMEKSLIQVLG